MERKRRRCGCRHGAEPPMRRKDEYVSCKRRSSLPARVSSASMATSSRVSARLIRSYASGVPKAVHMRFEHSLGVYRLAGEAMNNLIKPGLNLRVYLRKLLLKLMVPCQIRAYVTAARTVRDAQARISLNVLLNAFMETTVRRSKIVLPWPGLSKFLHLVQDSASLSCVYLLHFT